MGNKNKIIDNPRRRFLSLFVPPDEKTKPEMVKMLTADGKLVEVPKTIVDAASTKQKVTNKQILDWMENPSKDNI
jgi:hypothetical protein